MTTSEKPPSGRPNVVAGTQDDVEEKRTAVPVKGVPSEISATSDGKQQSEAPKSLDQESPKVSYKDLFRYATAKDALILGVSAVGAIAAGAIQPCFPLLFGDMAGLFQSVIQGDISRGEFDRILSDKSLILVYLGIGSYVATYVSIAGCMAVGERQTRQIRQNYFRALLRQEMSFFDTVGPGVLSTRMSVDCQTIQEGVSEKVAFAITSVATLVASYIVGFIKCWQLTLVASSILVIVMGTSSIATRLIIANTRKSMAGYSVAGGIAEEVIGSVRTVKALGVRKAFATRFDDQLGVVEHWGRRSQICTAITIAVILATTYLSHALTFWSGSIFVRDGIASLADVITVAFAILVGSHIFSTVATHIRCFAGAVAAASKIFAVINQESPLDPTSQEGIRLDQITGTIDFRNVKHIYASRPNQVVLKGLDLQFPAGKTTAIVGSSGSGKSTIVGLVERFYTPAGGQILLDGHDTSSLNLAWLRQNIGLVGQEPVLFGVSIFENIVMGISEKTTKGPRTEKDSLSLEARVHEAAKQANAHDFIMRLPRGYDTELGEGGCQLSVGQKQRVAIARALIRNPAILLLDEATSALDAESEQSVREALKSASVGRTTIVVSHRLSTVTEADQIVVLADGQIVEKGTHQELQSQDGVYGKLFAAQQLAKHVESAEKSARMENIETRASLSRPVTHDEKVAELNVESGVATTSPDVSKAPMEKQSLWSLITLIVSFNRPEYKLLIVGLIFSILAGCAGPTVAFLLAKAIAELSLIGSPNSASANVEFWCLMMFVIGIVHLINTAVQGISFAICSERLVRRARSVLFRAILAKDVAFFDRDENRTGALTATLGLEAKSLAGVSGATLGTILLCATTLVAAMIVALAIGWKVALVCMSTVPVLLGCGFYRIRMIARFAQRAHEASRKSSAYAGEAVMSVRTVASLTFEGQAAQRFEEQLLAQEKKSLVSIYKSSVPYAASQSFSFFCVALAFWYGGQRIAEGEYTMFQFFLCFAEIIFCAQTAGMVFSFANDIGKAKKAAGVFHSLLRKEPTIDGSDENDSEAARLGECEGRIDFEGVHFTYPNRPQHPVLRGLDLTIQPGQHVALVGSSGCGKSTCFALLERFYDPNAGAVKLDGQDIKSLDVAQYRNALAYVGQEPTIYGGTIRENILLGSESGEAQVTDEQIERACREANIFDFISSLPDGYSTHVGSRGVMLSGGQKQRIAIARALIRNPRVLLLDEATSALDSVSERLVQDALDKAAKGRTTISVAHRLSFVRNADKICVVEAGRIVEAGTHAELMSLGGRYYNLTKAQALEIGNGDL